MSFGLEGSGPDGGLGEVAPAGPEIKHGTFNGYTNRGCRCDRCRRANSEHQKLRSQGRNLTADQAKYCQVCGVRTSEHPFKACWRELR